MDHGMSIQMALEAPRFTKLVDYIYRVLTQPDSMPGITAGDSPRGAWAQASTAMKVRRSATTRMMFGVGDIQRCRSARGQASRWNGQALARRAACNADSSR